MKTQLVLLGLLLSQTAFADFKIIATEPIVQQVVEVQLDTTNCKTPYWFKQPSSSSLSCIFDLNNDARSKPWPSKILASIPVEASLFDVELTPSPNLAMAYLKITPHSDGGQQDVRNALGDGAITFKFLYEGAALK